MREGSSGNRVTLEEEDRLYPSQTRACSVQGNLAAESNVMLGFLLLVLLPTSPKSA